MSTAVRPSTAAVAAAPPFSRALRIAAGLCLVAGALLNGLSQALGHALTGDLDPVELLQTRPAGFELERTALVLSSLVMPLGLLGLAHVCRFRSRVLTAIATPLLLWGMWGFANILAIDYLLGTAVPSITSVETAVTIEEGLFSHAGVLAVALVPHLVGTFLGAVLLSVAAWRSGAFPRPALVLMLGFLLWDFLLPPIGPLDPHVLLFVSWTWLGIRLVRMPHAVWSGATVDSPEARGAGQPA